MFNLGNRIFWFATVFVLWGFTSKASDGIDDKILDCVDRAPDILEKLTCLPSVKSRTSKGVVGHYRHIEIQFDQPTDHRSVGGERFNQKLVLLHLATRQSMVLETSGYAIFAVALSKLSTAFGTNQLQVEHRFFRTSIPASRDWSKLDIRQSADDFHRITWEFKHIYREKWINTGRSKGGMTSIYHRHFYPEDLAGTVANVAPLSFSTADGRYVRFVNEVGGDRYASCREKLKSLQKSLLEDRQKVVPTLTGKFDHLGSKDLVWEHAVLELPFAFWQYGGPEDVKRGCSKIPEVTADLKDRVQFLELVNSTNGFDDMSLEGFMPYYYQAATQLGSPDIGRDHLKGLLLHPYNIDQYTPKGVKYSYSNTAMRQVENWMKTESSRILLVYGEFDPWSAGQFPYRSAGDSFRFVVPVANHGALLFSLPEQPMSVALEVVSKWLHKSSDWEGESTDEMALEDIEFNCLRSRANYTACLKN